MSDGASYVAVNYISCPWCQADRCRECGCCPKCDWPFNADYPRGPGSPTCNHATGSLAAPEKGENHD